MIWDAICFVIDSISVGKLLKKKFPVEEVMAEDFAKSKEGKALDQLSRKNLGSNPSPEMEKREPVQSPQPTAASRRG